MVIANDPTVKGGAYYPLTVIAFFSITGWVLTSR
jgi:hypothetical protein